jgi:predicted transposase YbfD/YdcC
MKLQQSLNYLICLKLKVVSSRLAKKISDKQADYVLAVKDNQKHLHIAITHYFKGELSTDKLKLSQVEKTEETDAGHGRVETRRCYLSTCLDTLPDALRWEGIKAIGMVENERTVNGKTSIDRRHYITTLTDVKIFAHAVRAHWGIENSLHWVLDVTFREDDSRIRKGYAPENFNILRQLAINMLKKEPSKISIKKKRFKAALSNQFREKIIFSG